MINRSLLHDGKLFLIGQTDELFPFLFFEMVAQFAYATYYYSDFFHTENTKQQEVYLFLFDEFLLITKIKRNKKVRLCNGLKNVCIYKRRESLSVVCCWSVLMYYKS